MLLLLCLFVVFDGAFFFNTGSIMAAAIAVCNESGDEGLAESTDESASSLCVSFSLSSAKARKKNLVGG